MPLHRVYAAKGIFTPEEKGAIAQSITDIYNAIPIPPFYTVVVFVDVPEDSIFVGGKANARFVRIVSQHLARSYSTAEAAAKVPCRNCKIDIDIKVSTKMSVTVCGHCCALSAKFVATVSTSPLFRRSWI